MESEEDKRTFIDQTDPGRVHAVLYVSRGGRKVERTGTAPMWKRGRRRKLEAEVGTKREDEDFPDPWEVRSRCTYERGTNVRGWSLASYYFTRATGPRVSRWSTNPQLTNGPSDNLCRLTHPVEICLRYTAAFSTTSRGRPFRVLSLLPPFTGRSTRPSGVYRILPRPPLV